MFKKALPYKYLIIIHQLLLIHNAKASNVYLLAFVLKTYYR